MKLLILIVLISMFTACSSIPKNVSPELSPYVSRFLEYYRQSLDVKLSDQGNWYNRAKDHVRIKSDDWYSMSPVFREMLMFHEFGHSILRRKHWNHGKLPDGCPYSMMFWSIDENCYKANKKHYLKELFKVKGEF